ncbi:MAG: EamA family transporter [Arcobacter sp.]|nr:MAG: EamA family transporter [Arcobacter sp.]
MLFASSLFAIMGGFAKELSVSMSSLEVVFFRNVFGVFLMGFMVFKNPIKQKGGKPFLLFFRGFIGFVALLAFFYNIAHISLADAMTFAKTAPIFTAFFAYVFLKEKMSSYGWLALFIGFIGIVLITQPQGLTFTKTDLLGIFSGLGAALAYTSVRELKKFYDTKSIVLSFMITGTLGPLLLLLLTPYVSTEGLDFLFAEFVVPHGMDWFYISGLGLFATMAQMYMTKAYGETKAGIVGAVSYSNIVFAIVIGLILGDSLPNLLTSLGIMAIFVAGILVVKK